MGTGEAPGGAALPARLPRGRPGRQRPPDGAVGPWPGARAGPSLGAPPRPAGAGAAPAPEPGLRGPRHPPRYRRRHCRMGPLEIANNSDAAPAAAGESASVASKQKKKTQTYSPPPNSHALNPAEQNLGFLK